MNEATEKPQKFVPEEGKIEIPRLQYNEKLCDCSGTAIAWGAKGFILTALGVPFTLRKLTFIPTRTEVRFATGLIGAVFGAYYAALHGRENCLKDVQEKYAILDQVR